MYSIMKYNKRKDETGVRNQLSVSIDFRFNLLRDVKKIDWKKYDCPWFRAVRGGVNWFGYCHNPSCETKKDLFVINRGYGMFKL